ncbi:hypothetical protein NC653_015155 [Populus alba x Populus x berolinensis]|uniref:Uncharacterized protein n=1 Tax=Populus alba x Populus x berolinensis TaxID=444605 RepID=A0AAD6W4T7_9ROSI|nr:hypothetical protein NC653_015155 [Populus alba x Populus x berolinensis]
MAKRFDSVNFAAFCLRYPGCRNSVAFEFRVIPFEHVCFCYLFYITLPSANGETLLPQTAKRFDCVTYDDHGQALKWVASHVNGDGPEEWLNSHADFSKGWTYIGRCCKGCFKITMEAAGSAHGRMNKLNTLRKRGVKRVARGFEEGKGSSTRYHFSRAECHVSKGIPPPTSQHQEALEVSSRALSLFMSGTSFCPCETGISSRAQQRGPKQTPMISMKLFFVGARDGGFNQIIQTQTCQRTRFERHMPIPTAISTTALT